jgi:hypothetical protein
MTGRTTIAALLLACPAIAAPPEAVPRIVISMQKGDGAKLVVEVENASPERLVLAARTYVVLLDPSDGPQAPRYWGEVKATALPSASAPMELAGRKRLRLSLDPTAVQWAPDRTGLSPSRPLARAVPPGEYELQVQIIDERGAAWPSSGIKVKVSRGGGLGF